jgi:hypothetical protein
VSSETDRLLLDAMNVEALLRKLAMLNVEAQHRLALHRSREKAGPAPAGNPRDEPKAAGAAARVRDGDPKPAASAEPSR